MIDLEHDLKTIYILKILSPSEGNDMNRLSFLLILMLSVICHYVPASAASDPPATKNSPAAGDTATPEASTATVIKKKKQTGHLKEIALFVLSKDGRIAVTADEDEINFLWDMKSGTLLRQIGKPEAVRLRVVTAAFSPDSSQLLWARLGKTTPVLWDVESGRRVGVLSSKDNGHTSNIISMSFSSDGRYIATGDAEGTVVVWNRADRSVMRRIRAHSGEVRFLKFVPGKNELASAGSDGAVRLWGVYGTELLATLLEPSERTVTALTTSVDGHFLYAALDDMTVKGWTVSLRRLRGTLAFDNRLINSIAVSPDGDYMAVTEENESILLWSIHDSRVAWKRDLDKSATQVLFSTDGKRVLTSGGDKWVREWDVASGNLLRKTGGQGD